MTLEAGTRLGPYEIVAPLGAGGMGEVYRARDPRLGREVAVKVLPESLADDPHRLRRFETEAKAAGALNHPNVLAVHDIGRHEDRAYVVYELLEGETLGARMRTGSLSSREALDIAVQTARGLAAAHAKGIVHRDLKPENLFLAEDGLVKVLDFGLAKLLRRDPEEIDREEETQTRHPSTGTGVVLGTVGYMSPEQVKGEAADHRTDVFSFGVVLHEMLSGQRPFAKETAAETLAAILREDPVDLSGVGVSTALAEVVARCLEKKPEARFQSAHDLAFALEALAESESGEVGTATGVDTTPAAGGRTRGLITLGVALAVVVVLAVGLWQALAPSGPPELVNLVQLTSDGVWKEDVATDGQRVYYATRAGRLFQMAATGGQPAALDPWPGEERVILLEGVSPVDPTQLLVRSGSRPPAYAWEEFPVWVLALPAATPRRLGEVTAGSRVVWSPGGDRIAYARKDDAGAAGAIFVANKNGELPRKILTTDTPALVQDWSSDDRITYSLYYFEGNRMELWDVRTDGSAPRRLLPDFPEGWFTGAQRTPDGRYLLFSSQLRGFERALWILEEGSRRPIQLTRGPLDVWSFTLDPEGRRVFAIGVRHQGEIFTYRPEIREWAPYGFPPESSPRFLDFSPDGEWVAFTRWRDGTLWRSRRDGTRRLQLTQVEHWHVARPRWSPDGERIAFAKASNRGIASRAWVVSKDGQGLRPVTEDDGFQEFPDWSPDGRVVVPYWGADEGPLRLVDLETGETEELPGTSGLAGIASSPDGRFLAAHDWDSRAEEGVVQIRLLDWETRVWRALEGAVGGMLSWSADGRHLFYGCGETRICRIRIEDGHIETVAEGGEELIAADWSWSLDPQDRIVRFRMQPSFDLYAWDLKLP